MNYINIGVLIGIVSVACYFIYRLTKKRKTYVAYDIIRCFAFGFSISFAAYMIYIGYKKICDNIEDMVNSCIMIGGFAIAVFAIDAIIKTIGKADNENSH